MYKISSVKDVLENGEDSRAFNEKTLVVYFSRSGNTRTVAEKLAEKLKADVDSIMKETSGSVSKTVCDKDPSTYGLVVVGTPVHGFTVSKPVAEYLELNRERFQKVATYATYSLWSGGTLTKMSQLLGKDPVASATFKSKDIKLNQIDERLDSFIHLIKGNNKIQIQSTQIVRARDVYE